MIIDLRTYTALPGKLPAFLKIYNEMARPIQWPLLGDPIGFFTTEVGELNQVVHMWRYDSQADREQRRAKLAVAPGWTDYLAQATPLLLKMENKLIVPTAFSPMK